MICLNYLRFGRKTAFTLGAVFFMLSSIFCTFSPWYSLFLVGRFGLGSASSGLFYAAYAMCLYFFGNSFLYIKKIKLIDFSSDWKYLPETSFLDVIGLFGLLPHWHDVNGLGFIFNRGTLEIFTIIPDGTGHVADIELLVSSENWN